MLASHSPMVRVCQNPNLSEGTLTAPWNLHDLRANAGTTGTAILLTDFRLELVHFGGGHLTDGGDLAVLDAPQSERTGDVAVLVELDRPDHPLVLDRLAFLDQLESLGEL